MVRRRPELLVLGFALLYPTLLTWLYFVALRHAPSGIQQGAYSVGKLIQFALPAGWAFWICREPLGDWRPTRRGIAAGIVFGLAVGAAMLGLYHGWAGNASWFHVAREAIRTKVAGLGIDSAGRFIAVGVFYALVHSAAEEYYWRWFVFGRLRRWLRPGAANVISSVGFLAHHVVLLATFFGVTHPATWIFSAAVGVGGVVWARLYQQSHQMYGSWLSHLLVDAAIFTIGYSIVSEAFH